MTEILIPSLYLLAGIMVYAMLQHFYCAFNPSRDPIQLLFGFMCLVTIPFVIFHAQMLQATDLPGFVAALKPNISSVFLFLVLFPWFIALYTGRRPWLFLSALSVLFAILLIANLVLPFSVQYEQLNGIRTLTLPWGETLTRGVGKTGVWIYFVIAGVYMVFGFTLFALISKFRASRHYTDMYMLLAVGLFFVLSIFGILVRMSIINFVELGPLGILAMVIAMSVILLQKRSTVEKEVSKLKNWQQTLLDSADYSIISTDADGIITSLNSAAQRMLGYLPEELIGKHSPSIFHDTEEVSKRAAELSKELGRTVLPGFEVFVAKAMLEHAEEREWTHIRKDGSRLPVRLSVTALHGSSREITGYMGIAADLTERNQTQSKLRDSNSKYQRLFPQPKYGTAMNGTDRKHLQRLTKRLENANSDEEKNACQVAIDNLVNKISVLKPVAFTEKEDAIQKLEYLNYGEEVITGNLRLIEETDLITEQDIKLSQGMVNLIGDEKKRFKKIIRDFKEFKKPHVNASSLLVAITLEEKHQADEKLVKLLSWEERLSADLGSRNDNGDLTGHDLAFAQKMHTLLSEELGRLQTIVDDYRNQQIAVAKNK